jgi:uncharacterized protein YndB with AHSA1/START domain
MSQSTVTLGRRVSAPPDVVFDAWTDASRLAAWWWPHLAGATYDVEAVPGGRYRISSPVIGATVSGVFDQVARPGRLGFTWVWEDAGEPHEVVEPVVEDAVQVTFDGRDGGTLVTVAHTSQAHAPDGGTEQGWSDVLDRLARLYDGQSTSSRS